MAKAKKYISSSQLMKRWSVDEIMLASLLRQGLLAYDQHLHPFEIEPEYNLPNWAEDLLFIYEEVIQYETENDWLTGEGDEMELSGKDARLLGQLKREKENWDNSLAVAVQIGIFCAQEDREVKRDEIFDSAYKLDKNITKATIEKIWKAIPVEFKKRAGAPKKK